MRWLWRIGAAAITLGASGCERLETARRQEPVVYQVRLGQTLLGFPKSYIYPSAGNDSGARCLNTSDNGVLLTGAAPEFLGYSPDLAHKFHGRAFDYIHVLITHPKGVSAETATARMVALHIDGSVLLARRDIPAGRHEERRTSVGHLVDDFHGPEAALIRCMRTSSVPNPRCEAYLTYRDLVLQVSFDSDHRDRADEILRRIRSRLDEWRFETSTLPECPERTPR